MNQTLEEFQKTLERSNELFSIIHNDIFSNVQSKTFKEKLTLGLCVISFEHASSIQILMETKNFTTAISLLRLQYEALTRAMWLHFAAKDSFIKKYDIPLDVKKTPPDFPTITVMIEDIMKCQIKGPGEMLKEIKDATWSGMNNYVHNGFHPIFRVLNRYPTGLLIQILQTSNAMNTMLAMVMANIATDHDLVNLVKKLQVDFQDCLPILIKPESSN
jgi:hypothetical protein